MELAMAKVVDHHFLLQNQSLIDAPIVMKKAMTEANVLTRTRSSTRFLQKDATILATISTMEKRNLFFIAPSIKLGVTLIKVGT